MADRRPFQAQAGGHRRARRLWRAISHSDRLDRGQRPHVTGSIGAREATVVHEWAVGDLAELEKSWAALGKLDAHKTWGTQMEPYVVSGSSRWEVFRVV
jgi:hypothetical protein